MKAGASNTAERIIGCMARWVPEGSPVFFTADDDTLYPAARRRWGDLLRSHEGNVFDPWSKGGKVDVRTLGEKDEVPSSLNCRAPARLLSPLSPHPASAASPRARRRC